MKRYERTIVLLPVFDGEAEKGVYLNRQGGLSQCLNHGFSRIYGFRGLVIGPFIRFTNDSDNLDITRTCFHLTDTPL